MTSTLHLHEIGAPGGDGPTVLLAHGMEDDWRTWLPLADRLRPSWRIVAADLPWRTGNDHRWWREAGGGEWLRRAEQRLGRPVDVLIGHSFGANSVLERLTLTPSPTRAAVLVAPFVRERDSVVTWQMFERSRRGLEQVVREHLGTRLGHRTEPLPDDLRESIVRKVVDRIGPVGFLALFQHFVDTAELPLEPVTVPTLIAAGSQDPASGSARAESLARRMPSATLRMREHYEHFCHIGQVDDIATATAEFVGAVLADPPGGPARKEADR